MPRELTLNIPASASAQKDMGRGSIFFVGTATTIIRFAGFTILTDPNFLHAGDHAHIGYGMTTERLTEPAFDIEALPPIDFCILSHYHGDHLIRSSRKSFKRTYRSSPPSTPSAN